MVDYHSTLVNALSAILPTYYEMILHSGIDTPCISYMEISNNVFSNGDTLGYSRLQYQVSVWSNSIAEMQKYSADVDDTLRSLGWTRVSSGEMYDNQSTMCRKILTFEALALEQFN